MHEQSKIYQNIKDGKLDTALKDLFENIEENPPLLKIILTQVLYYQMLEKLKKQNVFSKGINY